MDKVVRGISKHIEMGGRGVEYFPRGLNQCDQVLGILRNQSVARFALVHSPFRAFLIRGIMTYTAHGGPIQPLPSQGILIFQNPFFPCARSHPHQALCTTLV